MEFANDRPIYQQIVELILLDIIAERYKPGDKLPSVRDLALRYRVNPNTLQRAFLELENLKLVYTERTNGRYISEDKEVIQRFKEEFARTKTKEYVQIMKELNMSEEELITLIKEIKKG